MLLMPDRASGMVHASCQEHGQRLRAERVGFLDLAESELVRASQTAVRGTGTVPISAL